jgi:hypothetical protein
MVSTARSPTTTPSKLRRTKPQSTDAVPCLAPIFPSTAPPRT